MAGDPGKKNKLITLKRKVPANPGGDLDYTYQTVARVWADFRPLRMDERFTSDARHTARVGNFRVYWRDDLTPDLVIEWDGRTWNVLGIAEVGHRDEVDLTAEAVY
ncbi:MAG: head-tail adaptor protein [Gemmataceae bacterium]|nr:head-tail adaptor protein [Gemmataceae bacterium]